MPEGKFSDVATKISVFDSFIHPVIRTNAD